MKIFPLFLEDIDRSEVLNFTNTLSIQNREIKNKHIREVLDKTGGLSAIYDISKTEISHYISSFQSSENSLSSDTLPAIFLHLQNKISEKLSIEPHHSFLQIVKIDSGGRIPPHYDTAYPGYITFKCNISVQSEDYQIWVDEKPFQISEGHLYCFEASLYKHWTESFTKPRVLLSYGFALPYHQLGRDQNDPRVRLSQRIFKYFQREK